MVTMNRASAVIRRATGFEDYQACVELQKEVWGYTDAEDIVALPMLMLCNKHGGNVLVAQEPSGRFIGFSFAMIALDDRGRLYWWSHMTAVVAEHRKFALGRSLKMMQREQALEAGVTEIRWTFDPLQALNAHFNLAKLGAVAHEYEENVYGYTRSPLHRGLPTDRFVAEWHLKSERVTERVSGSAGVIFRDLDRIVVVNASRDGVSSTPTLDLGDPQLLLEIPPDIQDLKSRNIDLARDWQDKVRAACQHYFRRGYAATDFIRIPGPEPRSLYVLENSGAESGP